MIVQFYQKLTIRLEELKTSILTPLITLDLVYIIQQTINTCIMICSRI